MKSSFECIVCFFKQVLRTARIVTADDARIKQVLKATMGYLLSEEDWTRTPLDFGFDLYPLFYETLGVTDPYRELKKKSNELALSLYPWAKESIEKSEDPLFTSIKFAASGNIADYGAMDEFNLENQIKSSLDKDFAINDYPLFKQKVDNVKSLLYFLDNAGEAIFDKILIETLLSLYPKLEKISIVAKKYPIINDMTVEEAYELGFLMDERIEILPTWKDVNWRERLSTYDMVISKGQGNYEGLSAYSGIYFLLVAKCDVVARDLGVEVGDFIFKAS